MMNIYRLVRQGQYKWSPSSPFLADETIVILHQSSTFLDQTLPCSMNLRCVYHTCSYSRITVKQSTIRLFSPCAKENEARKSNDVPNLPQFRTRQSALHPYLPHHFPIYPLLLYGD